VFEPVHRLVLPAATRQASVTILGAILLGALLALLRHRPPRSP
jgi:hypothetical protein